MFALKIDYYVIPQKKKNKWNIILQCQELHLGFIITHCVAGAAREVCEYKWNYRWF